MAFEYFLYNTNFSNTLVDRSNNSFAPLPPDTGEIFIDFLIPNTQPLYLYRESGATIVLNDQATIDAYLAATSPPTEGSTVNQSEFTGYTATTDVKLVGIEADIQLVSGVTLQNEIDIGENYDDITFLSGVTDQNTSGITTNAGDIVFLSGETDTKVQWKNIWTGGTYQENDMVRDGTWTSIANKDTSDIPSPQAVGPDRYLYYPLLPSGTSTNAKQIVFGMQYSGETSYWLNGYRIYVTAGNFYEIISVQDPTGANQPTFINSFTAEVTGWREFSLVPKPIPSGITYQVLAIVHEPDPTPVTLTYNYDYIKPNNSEIPLSGEITQANKDLSSVLINRIDDDSIDHSSFFSGLTIGDFIKIGTTRWAIQAITPEITYFDFTVAPARQAILSGVQPVDFETTIATTLSYGKDPDYWSGSTQVKGVLGIDSGWENATLDDSQYGIDILIQDAYVSPDWDFVASLGTGAGSSSDSNAIWGYIGGDINDQPDLQTELAERIPKVTGATGNLAIFKSDGYVEDSGVSIDEITGGTGFYFYTDLTSGVTTVSTTNIVYLSGTSAPLTAGIWAIDFNAIGGNLSPNKYIGVSFYIDNILQGVENYFKTNDANVIMPFVITKDLPLAAGTHLFEIRFRNQGGVANLRYGSIRARLVN